MEMWSLQPFHPLLTAMVWEETVLSRSELSWSWRRCLAVFGLDGQGAPQMVQLASACSPLGHGIAHTVARHSLPKSHHPSSGTSLLQGRTQPCSQTHPLSLITCPTLLYPGDYHPYPVLPPSLDAEFQTTLPTLEADSLRPSGTEHLQMQLKVGGSQSSFEVKVVNCR